MCTGSWQGTSRRRAFAALALGAVLVLEACAPSVIARGPESAAPHLDGHEFNAVYSSMLKAFRDGRARGPYDLVFYDGDHTPQAANEFWDIYESQLGSPVLLLYDDADWQEMSRFGERAEAAGFRDTTRLPLYRKSGKNNPETYTMRIMLRCSD